MDWVIKGGGCLASRGCLINFVLTLWGAVGRLRGFEVLKVCCFSILRCFAMV